jgi:hypothetical protein
VILLLSRVGYADYPSQTAAGTMFIREHGKNRRSEAFSFTPPLSEAFSGFIPRPAPAVAYCPESSVAVWFSGISNAEQAAHNSKSMSWGHKNYSPRMNMLITTHRILAGLD